MRAMVEATREFGDYDAPDVLPEPLRVAPDSVAGTVGPPAKMAGLPAKMAGLPAKTRRQPAKTRRQPGVSVSREERKADLAGPILGSEELAKRVWEAADTNGAMFIWQMLLSF